MKARIAYREHAPQGFQKLLDWYLELKKGSIETSLLHLVFMRASQLNGCGFCLDMHSKEARAAGETEQRLYVLSAWREVALFSERERAALEWTESVTLVSESGVPDAVYDRARKQFSEKELVDLTMLVANINAWNRLAVSFRAQIPG